ncbi:MAG: cyclic nucleotide-binding domain-containing protein [Nitrospinae bacterium]|nr:cyclic nucleotide-binding domain-containing protein [Nitrospinota bacterium]
MAKLLKKAFNIQQEELLVFSVFFFFYFLIGVQFSIGLTVSEALFLSEVGPGFLPYMYIFNALMIIFISTFYSSLTEKLSIPAMFKAVLVFFIVLVFGIKLLIFADFRAYAMPIAFPLLHTLFVMFTNMLPNNFRALYGQYLDVLQSKRLVPIILTGGRYGGIIGGLAIPLLIPVLGSVSNLLYVWIGAIVVSIGVVQYAEWRLRDHLIDDAGPKKRKTKKTTPKGGNLALMRTNRYVCAFALFSFIVVILRSFQDFQYSLVFREVFSDRAQLASFLGYFTAIGSAFSLLVQTFITPRIIKRLGLGTANLLYPLTTIIGLAGMAISPGFYSAVFLRFNNKNLQESIRNAINALLYNAVSPSIRARVGAFVAGQVVAVASIVSGVALLIIKPTGLALFPLSPGQLALISLFIAFAYLATGFFVRREYGAALRRMLEERNLGLFRYAQEGFGPVDDESMAILRKNIREGDDDLCVFTAQMMAESGRSETYQIILEEIPRRRGYAAAELLKILAKVPGAEDGENMRPLLEEYLTCSEPVLQCAAMDAAESIGLTDETAELVHENLQNDSPAVRARAVELLVRSDDLFWLANGLQTLHRMLNEPDATARVCALRCMGELQNPRFIKRLIPYLHQEEEKVREAALKAIEVLAANQGVDEEKMEEVIRVTTSDESAAIRRRGVRQLGNKGVRENFEHALAALSDVDSLVRRQAVESLKNMKRKGTLSLEGSGMLSFLVPFLFRSARNGSREMSAQEIVDSISDFAVEHLKEVYDVISHLDVIEHRENASAFTMLKKALEDVVEERQFVLLELLGVIGDEKTVDTVSESLSRGGSSSRAIAIETLSNFSSAGNTRLLILALEPLLLGRSTADKVSEGRKLWEIPENSIGEVLSTYMNSENAWLQAIALDAAGKHLGSETDGATAEWRAQFKARASAGDPYVREAAVAALRIIGKDDGDVEALLRTMENDENQLVRIQVRRERTHRGEIGEIITGQEKFMLSTIEKALFLKGVNMFETMSADELKILSNISREIQIEAGKVLFEQGDPCDYLYVIVDGEIEIILSQENAEPRVLATLGPTTSFGEIALFGDEGRSAGARASNDASLLGIEKEPLLELIYEHPTISIAIIGQLAGIIRSQNE